jgi:hypothetical protein
MGQGYQLLNLTEISGSASRVDEIQPISIPAIKHFSVLTHLLDVFRFSVNGLGYQPLHPVF